MWAKQSTAATLIVGPVLDSTGAEHTGLIIGDLSISKNGGTLTALASAATLTFIANGQYTLVLTTGNVDTLGRAQITCNKSTYQMPSIELMVLPSTVFDALVTNAVNATGGLVGATAAITTMAGVIATSTNIAAITGNITGNLSGSVGSVTGAVGSVTAAVTVGTINPDVVNASALAADAVAEIADGIWDEVTSGHTTAGTYGGRIVRATNSNVEVQITGSNHVAADVHEFQAGVITAGDFAANSITASALAADAVTEIQSGLATAANLLIVSDGVGYITSVLLGTISDAGTAGETYVITFGGATYTADFTGLDATGNRTGVTRSKV